MQIEIWSDIACPWCYVGKRRFEAALDAFEHRHEVTVTWRSFELDPSAPRERGVDSAGHLAEKYGMTREQAQASQQTLADVAAADGLDMRFDLARGGNTFDGHRLVHLAHAHGRQDAMQERLMRAYFTEGELIADTATLARLVLDVDLPQDEVTEVLATDRYGAEVRDDERSAASLGIHAVPFIAVDRRIGAAGARPPEALGELLRRGWEARLPA
jgi:predicted DsbA family dithiol-disulfide isomerase